MIFSVEFPEENQAATTANTLLQIYAANTDRPLRVLEVSVSGPSATDCIFQVCIQTSAGGTATSVTPRKITNADPHSIEATATRKPTGSDWGSPQPTTSDILLTKNGFFDWFAPHRDYMMIQGGNRVALRMPVGPASGVDMTAYIVCEE